ncbi:MAG: MurT ligase domain-containing protein [Candidatus Levybacteria bacterium]|nr:MurT ligase domain-containing protein [Candidatus Levybacteria bacterium]
MIDIVLISIGKVFSKISKLFNMGSGSTWPGHIALSVNNNFIKDLIKKNKNLKIILIAGTNGKTTTAKLIRTILEKNGEKVFQNESGANLLNGIASTILSNANILGKINYDFAIFEVDENVLPLILEELSPRHSGRRSRIQSPLTIILLDLFRDQLDRYGEVDSIARKWKEALSCHSLEKGNPVPNLILNADDPQIAYLGISLSDCHSEHREESHPNVSYFGLNDKSLGKLKNEHAADTIYCPNCGEKLIFDTVYFSHIGIWKCNKCKLERPKPDLDNSPIYPLPGIYNRYNTLAAVLFAKNSNINNLTIQQSLKEFNPAFGRQELLNIDGKQIHLFLSKNPTSFNESLRTIIELGGKNILFVLNDRIPDGRDVSWIWDTEVEELADKVENVICSGDRAYDMGLRVKYSVQNSKFKVQSYISKFKVIENLDEAIKEGLKSLKDNETLYILPTYSAMLEVRKILTGKKIL